MIVGDIASESVVHRDRVVYSGCYDKIINCLKTNYDNNKISQILIKSCLWAISCFFRGLPKLKFDIILPVCKYIILVLYMCNLC